MIIYVVKPGDTIYSIAKRYGIKPQTIIRNNGLTTPNKLVVGQTLVIMSDNLKHTVEKGDTLYSIARRYGVSLDQLKEANPQLQSPYTLTIGQVINIPVTVKKDGTIEVNGYAFPGINRTVLRNTLPYLTYLSIFSYQVKPDGSLTTINDAPLIDLARKANVAPIMVITNLEEGGGFSSEIANAVLTNDTAQQNLLDNIEKTLKAKNYYGLNIDFEYVNPSDGDEYDKFLETATSRFNALGYKVFTSLAPKTSANQKGQLYEAHHYPVHGRLANRVILMTYEWGYTYGPPLAVAPINQVKRVLDYAVTVIPSRKILMGMPNYGYDWTLPYKEGTPAKSLSNTQAVDLAIKQGASINYDRTAQTPYFYYKDSSGKQHIVWFDDARSIYAKLRLIEEYDLAGVSYWTILRYNPQNWLILSSMYNIQKVL